MKHKTFFSTCAAALAAASLCTLVYDSALAAPAPAAAPSRAAGPALPLLPSVPRVRVEVARGHMIIVQDVNLPRGNWRGGDLEFYVSFGAPGAPFAFDAHLLAVPDGALEPATEDHGEPVATERAIRRPANSNVYLLLGRPQMAGAILHVRDAEFRRILGARNMAALRLRTVLSLPEVDPQGGHEVVVRLGTEAGTPLTLGRVQVESIEKDVALEHAEAHLCGKDADPYPLAVTLRGSPSAAFLHATPDPKSRTASNDAPVAPVLSVRHATDDLCIRYWSKD